MLTVSRLPFPSVQMLVFALLLGVLLAPDPAAQASSGCERWVAPPPIGSDSHPGTRSEPWASLTHAVESVPDAGCVVLFEPGVYEGGQEVERRFATKTRFISAIPYRAVFEHSGSVIDFDGARNVEFAGFEVRHSGPGSSGYVINVDQGNDLWAEKIVIRNNIIHDSWDNDLLKVHNGSRQVTVTGNVFYNQGPSEQHMDVNSVTDVTIEENIFFNDFAGSNRSDPGNTKHFIVVKDSNEGSDGLLGTERVTIARNVFLHWQGGSEDMIKIGNDGKAYHEAEQVRIDTNLFVGDSADVAGSPIGVSGAKDVFFVNNTVVGDLPSKAFGIRLGIKGSNPLNENIRLHNNVWSDPTGTMGSEEPGDTGKFSTGESSSTKGLELRGNAYWNAGKPLPVGDVVSPSDDPVRISVDPGLGTASQVQLPRWTGSAFQSGNGTIRQEFTRIAHAFGSISSNSPLIGRADDIWSSATDLLGRSRGASPSLGALEPGLSGRFVDDDGSIFEADIEWLAAAGITKGCNPPLNNRFCPDREVTRGQMAAFLHRALDGLVSVGGAVDFVDDDGSIFEADIEWLAAAGITKGCNPPLNNRFCPDREVTRGQMAAFLHRALRDLLGG